MLVYMSLSICSSRGPYCADLLQALFDSRMLLTTLSTNNNGLDACHTMLTCAFLMTSYSRCDMMSTQDYYQHGSANSLDFHEARNGDHTICPFECDVCIFRKLRGNQTMLTDITTTTLMLIISSP